jgi:cytochrome P450
VLDDLLSAAHEDGTPLGDRGVRDSLITILIAGHDTTALTPAWALAEIAELAEVADRLIDELGRVTCSGPPEAEHLSALEYLEGTIRESLRLRPVASIVTRKTMRPFVARGRAYPPGVVSSALARTWSTGATSFAPNLIGSGPSGSSSESLARTSRSPSAAATG